MEGPKILLLDRNHPLIVERLSERGFLVEQDYRSSYDDVLRKIGDYEGLVIRSRIPLDKAFLQEARRLKFIARVGSGMENIEVVEAKRLGISLINSPEGNRDAVAEHLLGMLLLLMNRILISSDEVKRGIWLREENRGDELYGKTFGIIGYGNMGRAVAQRLSGFGVKVIFHDILPDISDQFATQVSLETLKRESDILSLHIPLTQGTRYLIDAKFIESMSKNFYFINTSRGENVRTSDLVEALKKSKVIGACLDVLEYEKSSFENISSLENKHFQYLLSSENVIVTPHIAGWTHQSKEKLASYIVDKILRLYGMF